GGHHRRTGESQVSVGKQTVARSNASAASKPVNPLAPGPLPRTSDATPLTIRPIIKLDRRSMVWARDGIATQVESIGPFFSLFMSAMAAGLLWMLINAWPDIGWGLAIACILGLLAFAGIIIYFLKISVFNTYADLHFNRKT